MFVTNIGQLIGSAVGVFGVTSILSNDIPIYNFAIVKGIIILFALIFSFTVLVEDSINESILGVKSSSVDVL